MRKMSTLFVVEYHKKGEPGVIYNQVRTENRWVFDEPDQVTITRKFDGTATAVIGGELYKRYDAKHGKTAPAGAIPCCAADPISGHHPHWIRVDPKDPANKYLLETWVIERDHMTDGTYEFIGERVGGNPEGITGHTFVRHGLVTYDLPIVSFDSIRGFLKVMSIEGLVFHHEDGRMCKIRKTDFGMTREV